MCIKFTEKQISDFSKSMPDMLKDKNALKLFQKSLKAASHDGDYVRALDLWIMIENLSPTEREGNREKIERTYDSVDEFSIQGSGLDMMQMQSDCIKYLQDKLPKFLCELKEHHSICS